MELLTNKRWVSPGVWLTSRYFNPKCLAEDIGFSLTNWMPSLPPAITFSGFLLISLPFPLFNLSSRMKWKHADIFKEIRYFPWKFQWKIFREPWGSGAGCIGVWPAKSAAWLTGGNALASLRPFRWFTSERETSFMGSPVLWVAPTALAAALADLAASGAEGWALAASTLPSLPLALRRHMRTDHSVALNVLFLTFARQHVYPRPNKKSRRMGYKCLSMSDPIIVKQGLDSAATLHTALLFPSVVLPSHSEECLERWIKADRHRYRLTESTPRWRLLEFTRN